MCNPLEHGGHRWGPMRSPRTLVLHDPRLGNLRERTTVYLSRCQRCGTRAWFSPGQQPFSPVFGKTYGTGYRLIHQGIPYPKEVIAHVRP